MNTRLALTLTLTFAFLAGCARPMPASPIPGWTPLPATFAFPTVSQATPSATTSPALTVTATGELPANPTETPPVACPATGTMGVALVSPEEALNIRSGPGVENSIEGIYSSNETGIALTGASAVVDDSRWVQVCNADNGTNGWVNGAYLTEVIPSGQFCGDTRVTALLDKLQTTFANSDGQTFASLVSPTHGVDVWLWNSGAPVNFDADHARFAFESDFVNDWGAHPASGIETSGTFPELVLPELQDTFVASAQRRCNDGDISSYGNTWPAEYANINFYQVFRPGTAGVELDWNAFLVGVEYVNGQPYLFSLIHFIWTP